MGRGLKNTRALRADHRTLYGCAERKTDSVTSANTTAPVFFGQGQLFLICFFQNQMI